MMIKVEGLKKSFDGFPALKGIDLNVRKGSVYGLVGPNGAGKSTLIRHLVGILKEDSGSVLIDSQPIFENTEQKSKIAFIPDDVFYYSRARRSDLAAFYKSVYSSFNMKRFEELKQFFSTELDRPLRKLSKGMQKQVAFHLALSLMPELVLLDEPIDGLDPVMRRKILGLLLEEVQNRGVTVLISSHNLRELEDVCDFVGIMNKGKMLLERSLSELQENIIKVNIALPDEMELPQGLEILNCTQTGRLRQVIIRGEIDEIQNTLNMLNPLFMDFLPLSLEEIFIYEIGGASDELKNIIV